MIQTAQGSEPLMSSGRNKRKLGDIDLGHGGPMVVSLHGLKGYTVEGQERKCDLKAEALPGSSKCDSCCKDR